MSLIDKKCVPCEGGVCPLKLHEFKSLLAELKEKWMVLDEKKIQHEFVFKDFLEAIVFVNKVAKLAEEEGHHPDIYIFYNKVLIELWTHNIGGLSENDFILAAKIEKLP